MARMIPEFIDDTSPPGERAVYNLLAGGSYDLTVLHSLDLAPWEGGRRTEIDFVIIFPDLGIMCMEVKSQGDISFDGSAWSPPSIRRSPFKQSLDGRHSFFRGLKKNAPEFSFIPVVHISIFPFADFQIRNNILSVKPWELIDAHLFQAFNSSFDFYSTLKTYFKKNLEAESTRIPVLSDCLTKQQIQRIVEVCVPIQKRRPDARESIIRRERNMNKLLRENQKMVLKLAEENERILVSGGAGTGKTLIAMELARRRAEKGQRVAFLCFNRLIGDWIKSEMEQNEPRLPNLTVGRAIQVMMDMAEIESPEKNPEHDFWEKELPHLLLNKLQDRDFIDQALFDYLVLDEAQDFFARTPLLKCLLGFLEGGDSNGKFAFLGDFENQSIVNKGITIRSLEQIIERVRPARLHLDENCRNYEVIGSAALTLADLKEAIYSAYLRGGGGADNYDIEFYSTMQEQSELIRKMILDLKAKFYSPEEIVLLSFCSFENSAAAQLEEKLHLVPAWNHKQGIRYSTIHAFKGMESKVIIITDVEIKDKRQRNLFYTGVTRATEVVRVLCSNKSKSLLFQ
jgi:ATP:corrinoid adenosyltransferase